MAPGPIKRTTYRDPTLGNSVRSGTAKCAEAALDMESYYQRLEQLHNLSLHAFGIAAGLVVSANRDDREILLSTGVAIDALGRHIAIIPGGGAEIGVNPDAPGASPTLAEIKQQGVLIPTSGRTGSVYLTISFRESFDSAIFTSSGVYRYDHTPWIQMLDSASFVDDGLRLVLAAITLGTGSDAGKVQAFAPALRRGLAQSTGSLQLRTARGSQSGSAFTVEDAIAADISPRDNGLSFDIGRQKVLDLNAGLLKVAGDIACNALVDPSSGKEVFHAQLMELTSGDYSSMHKHVAGSTVRPIDVFLLSAYATSGQAYGVHDVAWGSRCRVFAFTIPCRLTATSTSKPPNIGCWIAYVDGALYNDKYYLGDASSLQFQISASYAYLDVLTVVFGEKQSL